MQSAITEEVGEEIAGRSPLRVVEEIDGLLDALKLLTRTCVRRALHRETHSLELCSELLLRRRNYIVNASSSYTSYAVYPCDNCYITYPTSFLVAWLDRLLTDETVGGDNDQYLCSRTCVYRFGTPSRYAHSAEAALYPLGAPFVAGPAGGPPGHDGAALSVHLLGESDEIARVADSIQLVSDTLHPRQMEGGTTAADNTISSADVDLAESVLNLIRSRRHFGFDMDCVHDTDVDLYRTRLFEVLASYENRVAAETLDLLVDDFRRVR